MLPNELAKYRSVISVRSSDLIKVGEILWEKRRGGSVRFDPQPAYNFSQSALRSIQGLMQSLEDGYIELAEQLIQESQDIYKKAASNGSSNVVSIVG
jgi:hypothetical protein